MAILGGLKTVNTLLSRGIAIDLECILCHNCNETTNHLFFECNYYFSIIVNLLSCMRWHLLRSNIFQVFDSLCELQTSMKNGSHLYKLII
ncbi:hypothetical protein KFK09_008836 [Dendrobium nobile]|uniref:Reverse transcriptase zinc-binding domain-containing protein n=1 Tax=Dendrobium nobile TaxID=94219 RepID=A0A8T3BL75_DENNO|nr:hypothetical protein KFK09_008836 [Dendrobium nobile]